MAFDYEERTAVSYERKLKEIVLARRMAQAFSKDEVLEMYLLSLIPTSHQQASRLV